MVAIVVLVPVAYGRSDCGSPALSLSPSLTVFCATSFYESGVSSGLMNQAGEVLDVRMPWSTLPDATTPLLDIEEHEGISVR